MYSIAVHGGAGTIVKEQMTPELEKQYKDALEMAVSEGEKILAKGGLAIDAVEASVKVLENCPLFNAGKGAVFTSEGKTEMDASIMDGNGVKAGAVAFVQGVKNPISLAKEIMIDGDYVFLSGPGAKEFAIEKGLEMVSDDYFYTDFRWDQLQQAKQHNRVQLDHTKDDRLDEKHGTVGCVAIDENGNLAAATSTGGLTNKKYGRIGDSAIIGSGTYAENGLCAISCTGYGEYYIRGVVAYDVASLMQYAGKTLKEACDIVIHDKQVKLGSDGGLIAVDSSGNIELSFNSEGMYRASKKKGEKINVAIYK